jgi:hypothetical protein
MVMIISSSAWLASTRSAIPRWTVGGAPMICVARRSSMNARSSSL